MRRKAVTEHANQIIGPRGYRGPMWRQLRRRAVTASEIPVLLGLSPYSSRFDLFWEKRLADDEADARGTRATSRGSRVEHLVLEDFAEQHPEFTVNASVGLCQNVERPWQMCTPDALAYETEPSGAEPVLGGIRYTYEPVAVVEAKTSGSRDGWGDNGTDQIPVQYRAQVLWQMDTLGLEVAFVPVWIGFDYRCYEVAYDREDVLWMREQAQEFLADVAAGRTPDIDSHKATTSRLKALHPSIVPGEVEVPPGVVIAHQTAKRLRDAAQDRMNLAENRLRALMGDHAVATVDGKKYASRSVFDVPERTQVVPAHTQNRLYVSKRRPPRDPAPEPGETTKEES